MLVELVLRHVANVILEVNSHEIEDATRDVLGVVLGLDVRHQSCNIHPALHWEPRNIVCAP